MLSMCPCFCRSNKHIDLVSEEDRTQVDDSYLKSVRAKKRSRSYDLRDQKQVTTLEHNRELWGKGFAVEVYSQSDKAWYPGQIVEVIVSPTESKVESTVKVVYNGKTKSTYLYSGELKPFQTSSDLLSNCSFQKILQNAEALLTEQITLLNKHKPEIEPVGLDGFVSYCQSDAQDAVGLLYFLLKSRGFDIWFDQHQDDISVSGMSRGIYSSRVFIIFLSKSYFKRVFTIFELETALALKKEIIVIWEGDERRCGYSNFKSYMDACPDKYRAKLFEKEAIKIERRKHLQEAQLNTISERILQTRKSDGTSIIL